MNTSVFIFSWGNNYKYAEYLYEKLLKIFPTFHIQVINSCESHRDNWHNIGEDKYFNDQFIHALNEFQKNPTDIFCHIQADTACRNWGALIESICSTHKKYQYGIYSPFVSNVFDDFHLENEEISPNIYTTNMVDETVWSVDKTIIDYFFDHKIYNAFVENFYGWGYDQVFCAISNILNKPVILDKNHEVYHNPSQQYNTEIANKQYRVMRKCLPIKIDRMISRMLYRPQELNNANIG